MNPAPAKQEKNAKPVNNNTNTPALTKKMGSETKMPTIAGISLPEIAVLGAAGFVLWKNREKVQTFLQDNGIETPSFLSGDLTNLIQSGVSMIGNKGGQSQGSQDRGQDRGQTSGSSSRKHDA